LGKMGDLVRVAEGYGRNFLIPQKKAMVATEKNVKALDHQKRQVQYRIIKTKKDAEAAAQRIEGLSCTLKKNIGESGKLFGSVTTMEIETFLKEHGITVDRKKIHMDEPIKSLGMFSVPIRLHPDVTAHLKVWVEQEG